MNQNCTKQQAASVRGRVLSWAGPLLAIAALDYLFGPEIRLIVLYAAPIGIVAWQHGRGWGFALAVAIPLLRLSHFLHTWELPLSPSVAAINAVLHAVGFAGVVLVVHRLAVQSERVRLLEEFIHVCMFCKHVLEDQQPVSSLERYISERTDSQFSHGICPACAEREYGYVEERDVGSPDSSPGTLPGGAAATLLRQS